MKSSVSPPDVLRDYKFSMKHKPLIETNPYLRDPEKFCKALITTVASSTAIETGATIESIARTLIEGRRSHALKKTKPPFPKLATL